MAAVTRLLPLPQLQLIQHIFPSLPNIRKRLNEAVPTRNRTNGSTVNFRWASNISRLQPTFPENPDEFLFESSSTEYEYEEGYEGKTLDSSASSLGQTSTRSSQVSDISQTFQTHQIPTYQTQTYPCDALAAAAQDQNLPLATALLNEYTQANIAIKHRPQYERLAMISLRNRDLDAFFSWLSFVPAANVATTSQDNSLIVDRAIGQLPGGQETDFRIIEAFVDFSNYFNKLDNFNLSKMKGSRLRGPLLDHVTKLLLLFIAKDWVQSSVPTELVGLLSQYLKPEQFYPVLREMLSVHEKATQARIPVPAQNRGESTENSSRTEVDQAAQAAWIARAVHEFSIRNKPQVAYNILLGFSPKQRTTVLGEDVGVDAGSSKVLDLILSQHVQAAIELYHSALRERQSSIVHTVYALLPDKAGISLHQDQNQNEDEDHTSGKGLKKVARIRKLTNTIVSQHAISLIKSTHSLKLARSIYQVGGNPINEPVPATSIERQRLKTAQLLRLLKRELASFSPPSPSTSGAGPSPSNGSTIGTFSKVMRSKRQIQIDHRPVAFLFHALSVWNQEGEKKKRGGWLEEIEENGAGSVAPHPDRFFQLFRRRIKRNATQNNNNDYSLQVFWALVEFERLCVVNDSHSAVHFYRRVFSPEGAPKYLSDYNRFVHARSKEVKQQIMRRNQREKPEQWGLDNAGHEEYEEHQTSGAGVSGKESSSHGSTVVAARKSVDPFWLKWMEKTPLRTPPIPFSLPPSSPFIPSRMKLRPNNVALQAIWKASLTLSVKDPDAPAEKQLTDLYLKGYDYRMFVQEHEEQLQTQLKRQLREQEQPFSPLQPVLDHSSQAEALSPQIGADSDFGTESIHFQQPRQSKPHNITHLSALFEDFLSTYDRLTKRDHFFFSNLFTRGSIFELFLRRLVKFAPVSTPSPSFTASLSTSTLSPTSPPSTFVTNLAPRLLHEMQARGVDVNHRIWTIFASMRVQSGDPEFMLQVLEILERDMVDPLDFSPDALKNMSKLGFKPIKPILSDTVNPPHQFNQNNESSQPSPAQSPHSLGDSEEKHEAEPSDHLIPQKIFDAYRYAFKQLIKCGAFPEAVQLHQRILDAGYVEGTSFPFDRLVYELIENIRTANRNGGDRTGTRIGHSRAIRGRLGVKSSSHYS